MPNKAPQFHTASIDPSQDARSMLESDRSTQNLSANVINDYYKTSNVYLYGKLFGQSVYGLVDSGCSASVCPLSLLPENIELQKSSHRLFAANRTEITVLGEVDFIFEVDGHKLPIHAVVTPDVSSLIFGIDFMNAYNMLWNCTESRARLNGKWFNLVSLPNEEMIRRIYLAKEVYIPPETQIVVPVKATLPSLCFLPPAWYTISRVIIGSMALCVRGAGVKNKQVSHIFLLIVNVCFCRLLTIVY